VPGLTASRSNKYGDRRSGRGVALSRVTVRLAAHLAAWMPFLISAIRSARGSVIIADGAAISLRAWDVLTPYGPLVGQATQLRNGAFDPGPLQYWLLAIPVHVDPREGAEWGAALCCIAAGSLAIEAAWSALGACGGLAASAIILGIVAWQPLVGAQPYWNPWFGVMFFLAALAAGLAVMCARRRWWPVLVVTASVAIQAHLMFALASAALVLLALVVGVIDTVRAKGGYWWAGFGLTAGVACWAAPLIQQFTGHPGNLGLLVAGLGARPEAGPTLGLKALAASFAPPPVWWTPTLSFRKYGIEHVIGGRPAVLGVVMLALTAVALVVGFRPLRSRRTTAMAAISLLTSGAVLITYSAIPTLYLGHHDQNYLLIALFPAGLLAWVTIGSAAVLAARRVVDPARPLAAVRAAWRGGPGPADATAARWAVRAIGFAAIALIGLESWLGVAQLARASADATSAAEVSATRLGAAYIERLLPPQPVALSVVNPARVYERDVTLGVAWALRADGYLPEVNHRAARYLGPRYLFRGQPVPQVTVVVRRRGVVVHVAQTPGLSVQRRPPGAG
jgi:hypothetical protein